MTEAADPGFLAARAALTARQGSPQDARALALQVLDRAELSDRASIVAMLALGSAERELNDLDAAVSHINRAHLDAIELGDRELIPECGLALVSILSVRGDNDQALALLDEIDTEFGDDLDRSTRADLWNRRAVLLENTGDIDGALVAYDRAVDVAGASASAELRARILCNRGIARGFGGQLNEALTDSLEAERVALDADQQLLAAGAAHNAGFVAGRLGRVTDALTCFDRADQQYAAIGYPGRSRGVLASDRSELLVSIGLLDEAVDAATTAVDELTEADDVVDLAEAQLRLARALIAAGRYAEGRERSLATAATMHESGRSGWELIADLTALRATALAVQEHRSRATNELPPITPEALVDALRVRDDLHRAGWRAEATLADLDVATINVALGRVDVAEQFLASTTAARDEGPMDQRAEAWLVTALVATERGDPESARYATEAGLDALDAHRSAVGALDLRIAAGSLGRRLGALDLELAFDTDDPVQILSAADRDRGRALSAPHAVDEEDGELRTAAERVRECAASVRAAQAAGRPTAADERRLADAEARLRDRSRLNPATSVTLPSLDLPSLQESLGDATELIELIDRRGELQAAVVSASTVRIHAVGKTEELRRHLDSVRLLMRRAARPGGIDEALSDVLDRALAELDDRLIAPLSLSAPTVVTIPTTELHTCPWSALGSLRGRVVSSAASAAHWTRSARRHDDRATGPVVLVAGPDLAHAGREIDRLRRVYPDATILVGADADLASVVDAISGASLVHVACHAEVRASNPMLSSLRLWDGDLTGYDVARVGSPPATVVLSACDAGAGVVGPGDELVGTASMLCAHGVGQVIAPTTLVNDERSSDLMVELHRFLSGGAAPASALRELRRSTAATGDPTSLVLACSLMCRS